MDLFLSLTKNELEMASAAGLMVVLTRVSGSATFVTVTAFSSLMKVLYSKESGLEM